MAMEAGRTGVKKDKGRMATIAFGTQVYLPGWCWQLDTGIWKARHTPKPLKNLVNIENWCRQSESSCFGSHANGKCPVCPKTYACSSCSPLAVSLSAYSRLRGKQIHKSKSCGDCFLPDLTLCSELSWMHPPAPCAWIAGSQPA